MKKGVWLGILCCLLLFAGCNEGVVNDPNEWIPKSTPASEENITAEPVLTEAPLQTPDNTDVTDIEDNIVDNSAVTVTKGTSLYTAEELYTALETPDGRVLSDMLWENQKNSGIYQCTEKKLKDKNLLTYYISSSEGDDDNSGRTPEEPKKSLSVFSGASNINVMLKCGDTFSMEDSFYVGNNVILGAYGDGARPVLDFYRPLELEWKKVKGEKNVWSADLSEVKGLYNGTKNKSDCNIGHLIIDGEANWKRLVLENAEEQSYPELLGNRKDGCFAVDWTQSVMYLFSKTNPNSLQISYALPQHGLTVQNVTGAEVLGLEIKGAGFHGISLSQATDIAISGCYIHHIGGALLKDRGPRYGNAIELWDSGSRLSVTYNMAEWIYDTCYTNQGNTSNMTQRDLLFSNNLGRFSFWGIETWGDGASVNEFSNIVYEDNLLMYACDITNPEAAVYVNEGEQTMDAEGTFYSEYPAYVTYRGDASSYPYNQMSLLNAANARKKEALTIRDNVFWGTKRLLTLLKLAKNQELCFDLQDNLFYAEIPEAACVFRYTHTDNSRTFTKVLGVASNQTVLQVTGEEIPELFEQAEEAVKEKLYAIATASE